MNISLPQLLRSSVGSKAVAPDGSNIFSDALHCASPGLDSRRILSADTFTEVLEREHRRTERSRHCFALMRVDVDATLLNGNCERSLRPLADALFRVTRDTDFIGWQSADADLAALFTELGPMQDAERAVAAIRAKIMAEIERQIEPEIASKLALTFTIYPQNTNGSSVGYFSVGTSKKQPRGAGWICSRSKRVLDVLGSIIALVLLSPLLSMIAVAIKATSRGPVLFRQERVGEFGTRFTFLKFRSMMDGNDCRIHKEFVRRYIAGSTDLAQHGVFKLTDDPRITPLGRFLRKTSLDELPQFWNVLRGDMSLVGPRPALPYEIEAYDLWHRRRFLMAKPGITGLWQVSGRSKTTFDEMVRLDLRYARISSFWLDARVLLRTPLVVIRGSGAY